MNNERNDTEIPEEKFREDFGGKDLRRAMDERRREKATGLAANGLLFLLLGPAVLAAIAAILASVMVWNGYIKL